jgi:hypothetical protein
MRDYRCIRNEKLRPRVFTELDGIPEGNKITVSYLAKLLTTSRLQVQPKTVSSFMKERDDFKSLGKGIWERVPV